MDNPMPDLGALLSDPAALAAAMEMAKGLFAGAGQGSSSTDNVGGQPPQAPPPQQAPPPSLPALGVGEDDKTKLLLALKPFLSPKRSEKVGTVISLMKAMQIMGTILPHDGGNDVSG